MADEKYIVLLKQGVEVWNNFRRKNKSLSNIDLSQANLEGINLKGANLTKVNLRQANLKGANLEDTNLSSGLGLNLGFSENRLSQSFVANLLLKFPESKEVPKGEILARVLGSIPLFLLELTLHSPELWVREKISEIPLHKTGADLSEANLQGANLTRANLQDANLGRTNLKEARLDGANLRGANLREANLREANLGGANLQDANLDRTNLREARLGRANLRGANLREADFEKADLQYANFQYASLERVSLEDSWLEGTNFSDAFLKYVNFKNASLRDDTSIDNKWRLVWQIQNNGALNQKLKKADFSEANLRGIDFTRADLTEANLVGADLTGAQLIETNLEGANLENCRIYGSAVWNLIGSPSNQSNLIITPYNEPEITVDDLEVAQFLYLLLRNEKLRNIIDNVVQKAVLILGRFTEERLVILKAIREKLREYNYLPILFDFEKPGSRNIIETVSTVAHLSRFIIADITDPQAIPGELRQIVPNLKVPVVPIFQPSVDAKTGKVTNEWGMFWDLREYDHVLSMYDYENLDKLLGSFEEDVIRLAEMKVEEILQTRQSLQQERRILRENRAKTRREII